jgi:hypothetical protein
LINYDQISIIFMEIQKQLYACMIVYTIMVIIMRDGMHKKCGSSYRVALARRKMAEIRRHIYLTLLEMLNRHESN